MLREGSKVLITCNSGGILGEIFRIYGSKKIARVGDIVMIAVKKVIANNKKIKKGSVHPAIVVSTVYNTERSDCSYASCGVNSVVLLQKASKKGFDPIGNRVSGYVSRNIVGTFKVSQEVRNKILSMASGVY